MQPPGSHSSTTGHLRESADGIPSVCAPEGLIAQSLRRGERGLLSWTVRMLAAIRSRESRARSVHIHSR